MVYDLLQVSFALLLSKVVVKTNTLESGIDVGPGKFVKKDKRRALKYCKELHFFDQFFLNMYFSPELHGNGLIPSGNLIF